MKKLVAIALVIFSSLSFAAEITVHEASIRPIEFRPYTNASFQMNQTTGEGFVRVSVKEERPVPTGYYDHMGRPIPGSFTAFVYVYDQTVRVENLVLIDKKVIYQGAEGDVDCGTLGVSRIFKRPTIRLSGNCALDAYVTGFRFGDRVVVKLITK